MKLKLVTKILTPYSKPEKLRERVFHSLSSCSFTFTWWTFVTFRTTQLYISWLFFGAPFGLVPKVPALIRQCYSK